MSHTTMQAYIVTRLLTGIITIFGVTVIVWGMINLIPGDIIAVLVGDAGYTPEEAEQINHELGLDRPLYVRYFEWIGEIGRGDLGESIKSGRDVKDIIQDAFPVTMELAILSFVVAAVVGLPLGVWSGVRQDRPDDHAMRITSILGLSVPHFWLGTMVIVLPAIWWGWVPPLFYKDFLEDPVGNVTHLIIPAGILSYGLSASIMRLTRSSVLEVLREDYVRTARAKGLAGLIVMRRHVLRNAILPVLTIMGGQIVFLLSGVVVIETVFNLPGLGTTMITALNNRDYPVITAVNLIFGVTVVAVNLTVDLLYRVFDPRITF